jgi:hypothetical protein
LVVAIHTFMIEAGYKCIGIGDEVCFTAHNRPPNCLSGFCKLCYNPSPRINISLLSLLPFMYKFIVHLSVHCDTVNLCF